MPGASDPKVGELLVADNEEISGWAIDPSNEEPPLISIVLNGIEATRVLADRRTHRRTLGGSPRACGFRLAVHETLTDNLPPQNTVEARFADGRPLPSPPHFRCELKGTEGVGAGELKRMLDQGCSLMAKSGLLIKPISARPGWEAVALADYQKAEDAFGAITGRDLFVSYGTLLGLVREGGLISHDDDIDAMFLLHSTNAEAAGRELVQVAAELEQKGQNIQAVFPGGNFHWIAPSGIMLDIFGCWIGDGKVNGYMFSFDGSRSDILPVMERRLGDVTVSVPAAPEKFLTGFYGADWRVPNPHFQWQPSEEVQRKMGTFATGVKAAADGS
jgi:hypothetical protein